MKDGRASEGGGIFVGLDASVTVSDCVIGPNNVVTYAGGGIMNIHGQLTLIRSTVMENHGTGTLGGVGIYTSYGGITTLINSTVSGNVTNNFGGGPCHRWATINLIHSTVSGNLANQDFAFELEGGGGGIYIDGGYVNIQNSIVAGNTDLTGGGDPAIEYFHVSYNDVSGTFTSQDGNLIGDTTGSTGWSAADLYGDTAAPALPKLARWI